MTGVQAEIIDSTTQPLLCDGCLPIAIAPDALPDIAEQVERELPLRPYDFSGTYAEDAKVAEVGRLQGIIDEIAGTDGLSDEARDYMREGGSIATALEQIKELRPPEELSESDERLAEARTAYTQLLTKHSRIPRPGQKKKLAAAASDYTTALAAKIEEVSDLHCSQCDLQQTDVNLTMESLVERGLSVLTRTILDEQTTLEQDIDEAKKASLLNRITGDPRFYRLILLGLLGTTAAKDSGLVPETETAETIMHVAETGVVSLAAFGFSGVIQKGLIRRMESRWASKQLVRHEAAIKEDVMVDDNVIERTVGEVPESVESKAAFLLAGRLFTTHLAKIKGMVDRRPEDIYDEYTNLINMVASQEVGRIGHNVQSSAKRAMLVHGLAIVGAIIAGPALAGLAEPVAVTGDLQSSLRD